MPLGLEDRNMTGIDLGEPLPIHLYERALDGQQVSVQLEDGTQMPLVAELWINPRLGDDSVVARCRGATLDVGCGAGRVTAALIAADIPALGIDVSRHAVSLSRRRGVAASQQDVFSNTPNLGRWQHVLLMDGNIGIAGDAAALLKRCRDLLHPAGTVIVEVGPPGTGSQRLLIRLVHGAAPSRPFSWLISDGRNVKTVGAAVGLVPTHEWATDGRWFVELSKPEQRTQQGWSSNGS